MSQHHPEDDIAYFARDLGRTIALDLTTVAAQVPSAEGALKPGRYLFQIGKRSASTVVAWIVQGKFGTTLAPAAAAPAFPMSADGVRGFELNVIAGYNDAIAAIMDTGSATLFITLVSRDF